MIFIDLESSISLIPVKILSSILTNGDKIEIYDKDGQSLNAFDAIYLTVWGTENISRFAHPEKAYSPIVIKFEGILIFLIGILANPNLSISFNCEFFWISKLTTFKQLLKAHDPIFVT